MLWVQGREREGCLCLNSGVLLSQLKSGEGNCRELFQFVAEGTRKLGVCCIHVISTLLGNSVASGMAPASQGSAGNVCLKLSTTWRFCSPPWGLHPANLLGLVLQQHLNLRGSAWLRFWHKYMKNQRSECSSLLFPIKAGWRITTEWNCRTCRMEPTAPEVPDFPPAPSGVGGNRFLDRIICFCKFQVQNLSWISALSLNSTVAQRIGTCALRWEENQNDPNLDTPNFWF